MNVTQAGLVDLEKKYWQASKDRDTDAALQLTDDPCIVTGAQGAGEVGHRALAGMLRSEAWTLLEFVLSDVHVRLIRYDVAIVAYKVHEELTVDGKPVSLDASDASTWVRREGRWLCALHTESLAGD